MEFIDLTSIIPDLVLDLRYTSSNNVCSKRISDFKKPYLLGPAANALQDAANQLRTNGYRIIIWDAGRTRAAQKALRLVCDRSEFVAEISKHNCGTAVDVSLADGNGQQLDLGTDFDDFSDKARAENRGFSEKVLQNRSVLCNAMKDVGFAQNPSEWWHFEYQNIDQAQISAIRIEDYVLA